MRNFCAAAKRDGLHRRLSLANMGRVLAVAAALTPAVGCRREKGGSAAAAGPPTGASTRPATTSAPADLDEAARRRAAEMLARLPEAFHAVVRPPFVVIGDFSAGQLERLTQGSVISPARAMATSYFRRGPDKVITVLLFSGDDSYRRWAEKLLGDTDLPHFGYYKPDSRTLVMNIATGAGTLVHELTHALIVYDFPDVPTWFNEGLASLHEQCQVGRDEIEGLPNWRLPALQKAVREKKLRPLREVLTRDDFYGPLQGANYAQARYFVMYLQRQGLLRKFYRDFRESHEGPDASVKAVERVFGRKLELIEADFLKWVMTLRFPPTG